MTYIRKQDQQGENYYNYSYLGHKVISHTVKPVDLWWMAEDELINSPEKTNVPCSSFNIYERLVRIKLMQVIKQ